MDVPCNWQIAIAYNSLIETLKFINFGWRCVKFETKISDMSLRILHTRAGSEFPSAKSFITRILVFSFPNLTVFKFSKIANRCFPVLRNTDNSQACAWARDVRYWMESEWQIKLRHNEIIPLQLLHIQSRIIVTSLKNFIWY